MVTNIRFFYNNLIDNTNVNLSPSSQITTLPVENIVNPLKSLPWRTADGQVDFEYVDIDLAQPYQINGFAALGHNYTDEAILLLSGDDSDTFYPGIDSNHIGFWKYNASGDDSGSSGNDLTANSIATSDYIPARQDRCVQLDGSSSFYSIASAGAGDFDFGASDDFSIEMWFMIDEAEIVHGLVSRWNDTSGYYLNITGDNKLYFKASDGTNTDEITGSTTIATGIWYHAAVTADRDGTLNLYLNGEQDTAPVAMSCGSLSNDADFRIGRTGSNYLKGKLAFTSISNCYRTSSYISDSYDTPKLVLSIGYNENILLECFDSVTARYWRFIISDPENPFDYLDTGRIFLGEWFEPTRNYHGNWSRITIDPTTTTTTLNNIEFNDVRDKYIELDLSFPKEVQIPQSDIEKYEEIFRLTGKYKRVIIALDYQNHRYDWSYYGTLQGDKTITHLPGTSHINGRWIISNLKFKESR